MTKNRAKQYDTAYENMKKTFDFTKIPQELYPTNESALLNEEIKNDERQKTDKMDEDYLRKSLFDLENQQDAATHTYTLEDK